MIGGTRIAQHNAWEHDGVTYQVYANNNEQVWLRIDDGAWRMIADRAAIENIANPAGVRWHSLLLDHFNNDATNIPLIFNIAGGGPYVVMSAGKR